jgi:hypothetical protein
MHDFYANPGPNRRSPVPPFDAMLFWELSRNFGEVRAMRLTIEIIAAVVLLFCLTATGAAFAAGKTSRSADGLNCSFSVQANASPARCAAIRRQCGGKFFANYCADRLLSTG